MAAMTWTDNQKRLWNCRIAISDLKRLKANGIDIADPETYKSLFGSALELIEIIAELLRPQWETQGLKYEDFADLMIETDTRFDEVQAAFIAGLTDFFQRTRAQANVIVLQKARDAADRANELAVKRAQSPDLDKLIEAAHARSEGEYQKLLQNEMQKLSGEPSTNAQA